MQTKLGIENLKKVLGNLVKTGQDIGLAASDGIQGRDAIVIWNNWDELQEVYTKSSLAIAEFRDLDPVEAAELVEHLAIELDIPNDIVEERIEQGFRWVARGYRLYKDIEDWVLDAKPIFLPKKTAA